jgi:hypothetical protein
MLMVENKYMSSKGIKIMSVILRVILFVRKGLNIVYSHYMLQLSKYLDFNL